MPYTGPQPDPIFALATWRAAWKTAVSLRITSTPIKRIWRTNWVWILSIPFFLIAESTMAIFVAASIRVARSTPGSLSALLDWMPNILLIQFALLAFIPLTVGPIWYSFKINRFPREHRMKCLTWLKWQTWISSIICVAAVPVFALMMFHLERSETELSWSDAPAHLWRVFPVMAYGILNGILVLWAVRKSEREILDDAVHCPDCDYSLAKILPKRCPECGSRIEPERRKRLKRSLAGQAEPTRPRRRFLDTSQWRWYWPVSIIIFAVFALIAGIAQNLEFRNPSRHPGAELQTDILKGLLVLAYGFFMTIWFAWFTPILSSHPKYEIDPATVLWQRRATQFIVWLPAMMSALFLISLVAGFPKVTELELLGMPVSGWRILLPILTALIIVTSFISILMYGLCENRWRLWMRVHHYCALCTAHIPDYESRTQCPMCDEPLPHGQPTTPSPQPPPTTNTDTL